MSVIQISAKELQKKIQQDQHILIDVREPNEFAYTHIEGSHHIPLNQIPQRLNEIDSSLDCIIICHHGMRSQQAAEFMHQSGFNKLYNLAGGINAWSVECDDSVLQY